MVPSCPDRQRHMWRAAATLGLLIAAGCGGDGGSPQDVASVAAKASASAERGTDAATTQASPRASSVQAAFDAEATGYDSIEAPASGRSAIGSASIAATQAAFDRVADVISR